ncbi:rab11 family-interacting protein 1 [Lissotriton helveticus]
MSLAQQYQSQSSWLPTHVQVTVLQARGLRSKGKAGTNDAYAIIQLGKERYSTTVAEKSHAPIWKEEATFELPLLHQDHRGRGTLRLILMHRALVGLDKHLGEVGLDLYQLHQDRNRRKTQWYKLQSKPGKKEKERGELEIDVQFMRNNMTASMFDLSMKEKSRSPFGKLKDKIKGKRQDGFPDTASAIVPSFTQPGADSDEEAPEKVTKKKSKLKNLFSKPGLQKSPLSQSMSVLPSFQPAPPSERTVLKPRDFSSDFNDVPLSSDEPGSTKIEGKPPHFPVTTHKRTVSADPTQINQIVPGNSKKEGLSFFSGLRPKNDPVTRSNLCINGNHVYDEEKEPKPEATTKDSTLTFTPKVIRKTPLYSSIENLSIKSSSSESLSSKTSKEPADPAHVLPDKRSSWSQSKDSLKSMTLPSYKPSAGEESREASLAGSSDPSKEIKETKKPESLKSSLLSLVTGKKDSSKGGEVESTTQVHAKEEQAKPADVPRQHSPVMPPSEVPSTKESLNPFEEELKEEEKKLEPFPPYTRTPKTTAVKPRLDVSLGAETKAILNSSSVTVPSRSPSALLSIGQENPFASVPVVSARHSSPNTGKPNLNSPLTVPNAFLSLPSASSSPSPPESLITPETRSHLPRPASDGEFILTSEQFTTSPRRVFEAKEIQGIAPLNDKTASSKSSVQSLLDQLKGQKTGHMADQLESTGRLEIEVSASKTNALQEERQEFFFGGDRTNSPHTASLKESVQQGNLEEALVGGEVRENVFDREREINLKARNVGNSIATNESKTDVPTHVQSYMDSHQAPLIEILKPIPLAEDRTLKDTKNGLSVSLANEQSVRNEDLGDIVPRPKPRAQIMLPKVAHQESSNVDLPPASAPPKPAPRSAAKQNKINLESTSTYWVPNPSTTQSSQKNHENTVTDVLSFEEDLSSSEMKMASPVLGDLKFRLDELPVIPENPEIMSDEEFPHSQVKSSVTDPTKVKHRARTYESGDQNEFSSAQLAIEERLTPQLKEDTLQHALGMHKDSVNAYKPQSSDLSVESSKEVDFPNKEEHGYDPMQEGSRRHGVRDREIKNSPQMADFSNPNGSLSPSILASHSSISLPSNPSSAKETDSPTRPPTDGFDRAESTGKKKLLRAWVSPSETPPIQTPPSASVPAKLRTHPVKPMSSNQVKAQNFGTPTKNQDQIFHEVKKYNPSDPAAPYGQLTHDELIQLVLKQKDTISKKESQVQELEEYIDNLLVRVMEETPSILANLTMLGKAGKV